MIAIVDAGTGNLRSVENALRHVARGEAIEVTHDPGVVARAARVVVPGQGTFADCGRALAPGGSLGRAVVDAIATGKPYLGICLGMQVLFESSEEAPGCEGLGVFAGHVVRIAAGRRDPATGAAVKVPHMGWNTVAPRRAHPVLVDEPRGGVPYYFVHSYVAEPADDGLVAGVAEYGGAELCAAVARDNVFAVQFHPEKSQRAGLALLAAFLAWRC